VFDPERDEDPGARRFYLRLLTVVAISAAGCLALWPSVSGFGAGPDHNTGCLAITDGWKPERSAPNLSGIVFPTPPSPQDQNDPAAMARWRTEWQAVQARPEVRQSNDYLDWKDGPGACISESRHRLIRSGIALVSLAAFCTGIAYIRRTRTNLRTSAEWAEACAGPVRDSDVLTKV
jgi:hypothetical protein